MPGSFDITAKEHFGEGQRIPPVRIWDKGRYLNDVSRLILSNTRAPADTEGDLEAQAEATRVCEREILRLVDKYSRDTIVTAFAEVQDYVENLTRTRIAELPDGVWETEDYLDSDPTLEEGLIPIKVRMEIEGDQIRYDLTGSHAAVGTFLNAGFGSAMSGVVGGTKTFFPEVPLNSGFYRAVDIDLGPEGTVVNAPWPVAVTGFCSGPYEKIMACAFEIWSQIMPERAIACSFNLEYLLVGGRDARSEDRPFFMWYDWMVGGWGGRNGRDGSNCTSPVFGVGLGRPAPRGPGAPEPRRSPAATRSSPTQAARGASAAAAAWRRAATLTQAERTVVSYCCDRARSITWGIEGGLPSIPHGVWLNKGTDDERFLGAIFSNVEIEEGTSSPARPPAAEGYGDPLERDPDAVLRGRHRRLRHDRPRAQGLRRRGPARSTRSSSQYEVDAAATERERARIAAERKGWLEADPEEIARSYRDGELDVLDLVRQYAVIVDWGTGELLPNTTQQFRAMVERRAASKWGTSALDPLDAPRERRAARLLRRPDGTRAAAVPCLQTGGRRAAVVGAHERGLTGDPGLELGVLEQGEGADGAGDAAEEGGVRRRREHVFAKLRSASDGTGDPASGLAAGGAPRRCCPASPTRRASCARAHDLGGELGGPGVAAEVGRPDAGGDGLEDRLVDRARGVLGALVARAAGVVQDGAARQEHRHRVGDVLALQRRRGAVRRLGHRDVDLEVVVEGSAGRTRRRRSSRTSA